MAQNIQKRTGVLLFQLDDEGKNFLLFSHLVSGENVLLDDVTTLNQAINRLQCSQADAAKELLRATTRLTSLQISLAQTVAAP